MSELDNLIKNRRSAVIFEEGIEISESELEEMFALNKFAPSAFNLQHSHYVTVVDQNKKEQLREAANGQYKVSSAC